MYINVYVITWDIFTLMNIIKLKASAYVIYIADSLMYTWKQKL